MNRMTEETLPWALSFPSSKRWVAGIQSEGTKNVYLPKLRQYCTATNKTPEELIQLKIDGLRHTGEPNEFQAEDLLEGYLYNNAELTDSAKIALRTSVMSFYAANRRHLLPDTANKISPPDPKQRKPKMEDLLKLDECMVTHRDRFALWLLASAPFRVGTATQLFWRDLQPTGDKDAPYRIVVESARLKGAGKGKYQKIKHVGFLHAYAAEKLERYKLELKEKGIAVTDDSPLLMVYQMNKSNKGKGDRLKSLTLIFEDACLMAWHDLEAKRFSPHDLRDFVQSALENAKVHPNLIAPLLGHKVKGVDFHYSSHDLDELLQVFKSALPWLLPESIEELKAKTQKEIAEERKKLVNLEFENTDLKEKTTKLSKDNETMRSDLNDMKQQLDLIAVKLRIDNQAKVRKGLQETQEYDTQQREAWKSEVDEQENK
jgi:integrase